ncbi:MAG: hypothetical protein F6K31_02480 [Symploca sp. SIO2G7]|nr:hypothetical protein [Symploca sp. SIO2G7]
MNFSELKDALGIEGDSIPSNVVNISTNTLTKNINVLIEYCYNNQPIVINHAEYVSEDTSEQRLIIKGKSSFLEVADLDIEAQFWIDEQNQIQLTFKYLLIEGEPGDNPWRFTHSFPQLPTVLDNNEPIEFNRQTQEITQTLVAPLDKLYLFNSYFVVVSQPQQEPELNVELKWGINFVSHLKSQGFLAVIEKLFQHTEDLTIYGTIRKPLPTETPEEFSDLYTGREGFLYPWNVAEEHERGLQGILLQVNLGLDYSIVEDKIKFTADKLYLYTPLNSDWVFLNTNPAFVPVQAYTGSVELPGADVKVDMVVPIQVGIDELAIVGFFEAVSLENLAQLVGLTGSDDDPLDFLPDEIQNLGDELGKLQLVNASVNVDYTDLEGITVSHTAFTIGMPELNWDVWDDDFQINSIFCTFDISYPFTKGSSDPFEEREVEITIYGNLEIEDVPFTVYSSRLEGYAVYAEMTEAQTLPLTTIMEKYAPGIDPPSDLTINIFRIGIAPRREYSMALAMAQAPNPWVIPIGPTDLTVEDVALGFSYPQGGPISGSVSGTISLGDFARFSIVYDTPGDIIMRAMIPEVSLNQLVDVLTNQALDLPDDFDIHFKNNSILIQKQGQNYLFQLATQVEGFGLLAFQVQKVSSKWGFAMGLDLTLEKPSQLSGLSILEEFEELFQLQNFLLVVSSFKDPSFEFPGFDQFHNPDLGDGQITLPQQASGVVKGLNIYAELELNTSNDQQGLLKNFLELEGILGITLQVSNPPLDESKLYVSYTGEVLGHPLNCQFGGQMLNGSLSLFLTGRMTLNIQETPQTFKITLLFVANGAFIAATMQGSKPVDFGVFQIGNLALQIGINWQGIPSLGIAGTITVNSFQSSIAVFFDSTEPSKSLVAGMVSDLTVKDVFDTFVSLSSPSEIDEILDEILAVLDLVGVSGTNEFPVELSAEDLDNLDIEKISNAFATQGVTIPSALQQVYLSHDQPESFLQRNASYAFLQRHAPQALLSAYGPNSIWYLTDLTKMRYYQLKKRDDQTIDVSVAAQFYSAPQATNIGDISFPQGFYINGKIEFFDFTAEATIDISPDRGIAITAEMDPIVIFNENLFSITAQNGSGSPEISAATYSQPDHDIEEFKEPHFYINGSITILGLQNAIYVKVTKERFEFKFENDRLVSEFKAHGSFTNLNNLDFGAEISVGINEIDLGPLGKIPSIGVSAESEITVDGSDVKATLKGEFEWMGETKIIAKFNLEIDTQPFAELPKIILEKVKDILSGIFEDALEWAKAVAEGLIEGIGDVLAVLMDVFKLSLEDAQEILDAVGLGDVCALSRATMVM